MDKEAIHPVQDKHCWSMTIDHHAHRAIILKKRHTPTFVAPSKPDKSWFCNAFWQLRAYIYRCFFIYAKKSHVIESANRLFVCLCMCRDDEQDLGAPDKYVFDKKIVNMQICEKRLTTIGSTYRWLGMGALTWAGLFVMFLLMECKNKICS